MNEHVVVSPAFRADPIGWVARRCEMLLAPGLPLTERDRAKIAQIRERFHVGGDKVPGPHTYGRILRLLLTAGLMPRKPLRRGKREARPVQATRVVVPERFSVGAGIPTPPPLRRVPFAMAEPTEAWDPAGMPGL